MLDKTVFVTVGTTKFDNLITTVLNHAVLEVVHNLSIVQFLSCIMSIDQYFIALCICQSAYRTIINVAILDSVST